MARLLLAFALCIIFAKLHTETVVGKYLGRQERSAVSVTSRYTPFKAELRYASIAVQNNGMVQYVIKVSNAADTECFFNFEDLEAGTAVNDVMRKGDVTTGILLLKSGQSWIIFNCFSSRGPVISQFLFNRDVPANVSTQMELRDENGCKMSEPVFSSNQNSYIIDIQAKCNFALKQENAMLALEGAILRGGDISYYINEESFNITRTYENGVAKSRFVVPKTYMQNINIVPSFTLQLREEIGKEKPLSFYKHMLLSDKGLDGASPAVSRDTVALAIHPSDRDTIFVRRGSKTRLICEAYGNPKPLVKWNKDGRFIVGQKDLASLDWDNSYEYKSIIIESMNTSDNGQYTCKAQNQGNTVTKSVNVRLCDPATIHFSTTKDENYINATLRANQDSTNKISSAYCYRAKRATHDAWIRDYDSPVTISVTESNDSWEQIYSWNIADKGDVPKEMYCEIIANCVIYPMTVTLDV